MFTPCVLLVAIGQVAAIIPDGDDPFSPRVLVRARAIRIVYSEAGGEKTGLQEVTFRIEYVYCGDPKLAGGTFSSDFSVATRDWQAPTFAPRIKEGEVGIWRLMPDEEGKLQAAAVGSLSLSERLYGWSLAIPTPARKIIGWYGSRLSYAAALKWADVVEAVYKAKPAERPALLRRHVTSGNPYIAAWAVRILAEHKPADLVAYLKKMLDEPNLSIGAQVTIDDILSRVDRKKWLASERRVKLLQYWTSGEVSETYDAMMVASHIRNALRYNDLDWGIWLPLMQKWVTQHYLSEALEYILFESYAFQGPRSAPTRNLIVRHAFEVLKTATDENSQVYAATWLGRINDLSKEEKAKIEDIKKKVTNAWSRLLLDNAIRASTPTNDR